MNENYFVSRRRAQKRELEGIMNSNPDLADDDVVVIFAKRTGLKHTTVRAMLAEVRLEGGKNEV